MGVTGDIIHVQPFRQSDAPRGLSDFFPCRGTGACTHVSQNLRFRQRYLTGDDQESNLERYTEVVLDTILGRPVRSILAVETTPLELM